MKYVHGIFGILEPFVISNISNAIEKIPCFSSKFLKIFSKSFTIGV